MLALTHEAHLKARGMRLIRPFAAQADPFVSCKPFKQRAVFCRQVEAQSEVAHRPAPDEVHDDFIRLQAGLDKGASPVNAHVAGVQYELLHGWEKVAIILMG